MSQDDADSRGGEGPGGRRHGGTAPEAGRFFSLPWGAGPGGHLRIPYSGRMFVLCSFL